MRTQAAGPTTTRRAFGAVLLIVCSALAGLVPAMAPPAGAGEPSAGAVDGTAAADVEVRAPAAPREAVAAATGHRVVAREVDLEPFALFGASWDDLGDDHAHAAVRLRRADGSWTVWEDLGEGGPAGEGGGRTTTEPVWADRADGYEVAVEGPGDLDGLEVHLVRLGPGAGTPAPDRLGTAAAGTPHILSRSTWGAAPPAGEIGQAAGIDLAVVHHTGDVAPFGYSAGDVPGILRAIQAYHLSLDWSDIGYNFVVDRFGRVWEGRAGSTAGAPVGAHAYGFNTGSVGVAVLGDFSSATSNELITAALAELIAWKLHESGAGPTTMARRVVAGDDKFPAGTVLDLPRVVGHEDLNATACPGRLRLLLATLRTEVAARYAALDEAASSPHLVGVTPARLLDTRPGTPTVDGLAAGRGRVPAGDEVVLQVTGRGNVPHGATAVSLNLTAVDGAGPGYLTAYPCGRPRPFASNLNYLAGQTVPNLAVVEVGVGGTVCLFAASSAVDVVADVTGWSSTEAFVGVLPARLLDTRPGAPTIDGVSAGVGAVPANGEVALPVADRAGLPGQPRAVALNLTATEATGDGYTVAWPCGRPRPLASNLNYRAGETVSNLVVVPLAPGEQVCLFASASAVHLVADVAGYVPASGTFAGTAPARLLDTRPGGATVDGAFAQVGAVAANDQVILQVAGRGGVALGARAAALNVTATEGGGHGYVTAWPCDQPRPLASNLNFSAGSTRPNLVVVRLAADGTVCLFSGASPVHLVADVAGWSPA